MKKYLIATRAEEVIAEVETMDLLVNEIVKIGLELYQVKAVDNKALAAIVDKVSPKHGTKVYTYQVGPVDDFIKSYVPLHKGDIIEVNGNYCRIINLEGRVASVKLMDDSEAFVLLDEGVRLVN